MIEPRSRPQQNEAATQAWALAHGLPLAQVILVSKRGYYQDSMGLPGKNDVGIYDDAMFLLSPRLYASFNANVDPSRYYTSGKPAGMATLQPGVWKYRLGIHGLSKPKDRQYEALVQAGEVTVSRYKQGLDTGFFGINIHHGSYESTSSEGCQTIVPEQWSDFIAKVKGELAFYHQAVIPYLLVG